MRVSIIGAGVVGQATGIGLHRHGHEVIFYDTDEQKLEMLAEQGYGVAESLEAIRDFDIHMICVNTPLLDGKFDLSHLESAITELAVTLSKKDIYQLVVVRSTVLPFTTSTKIVPLLQHCCALRLGKDYGICYNPEFLREAHALDDFLHPPVIIIGEFDQRSGDILAELYHPLQAPQVRTTPENAEAIKCFSNAYNAMKVSFFNKLYMIAENCSLAHEVISQALTKASLGIRLPEYYTVGGYPFGGDCLPKDLAACITFLKEQGLDPKLFEAVAEINEDIRKFDRNH